MKYKCLYCGCEREFVEVKLAECWISATEGDYRQIVNTVACTICGFVQLFAKDQVDIKLADLEAKNKRKKLEEERNKKIMELKKEINNVKMIISDENQTVKAVKEAQKKLEELQNELTKLNSISYKSIDKGLIN